MVKLNSIKDHMNLFGIRLKEERNKLNYSQKDMNDPNKTGDLECGVSHATIVKYEAYKASKPTLENAIKISRALNISLDYLTGLSNKKDIEETPLAINKHFLALISQILKNYDEHKNFLNIKKDKNNQCYIILKEEKINDIIKYIYDLEISKNRLKTGGEEENKSVLDAIEKAIIEKCNVLKDLEL